MLKRIFLYLLITVIGLVLISGCSDPRPPKNLNEQVLSIGCILPLKGDFQNYGQLCKNAIDLAVDEVNTKGGLLGMKVEAIPGDDGMGDLVAENIAQQYTVVQHVSAIVGPYTTQSALAAAPICQSNKTPMIAIRASEPQVTKAGNFIFRACYVDTYQGTILGKFAVQDLKTKNAAVVYNTGDESAKELIDNFTKEIEKGGGKVSKVLSYNAQTSNFKSIVKELAQIKPDVVLLPDFEDKAGLIIKEAAKAGLKTKYLGTDLWNTEKLYKIAGKDCLGSYLTQHFSPDDTNEIAQEFVSLYEGDFGVKPGPSAALAYDAINLVFEAIKKANSADPVKIRDALATIKNFKGVSGTYTFDNKGNPIKGGTIIKIVEGGIAFEKRIEP